MIRRTSFSLVESLPVLLKSFIAGVLLTELLMISDIIATRLNVLATINVCKSWTWIIAGLYLLLAFSFFLKKKFLHALWILICSWRVDLAVVFVAGLYFAYIFGGFGLTTFSTLLTSLSWQELRIILMMPIVIVAAQLIRRLHLRYFEKKDADSLLLSDHEGRDKEDDGLGFWTQAVQFAERVYNQGSAESFIFGIDAPWGTGKSTFVNLCKKYWVETYPREMIVYTFDPLRYENQDNLLGKFVDGLIKELKGHVFLPEISQHLSRYAKQLTILKPSFSHWGLHIDIPLGDHSIDHLFTRLEAALLGLDKKVVIVIDDLDRLSFCSVKEVLFAIKKSFTLPNLTYVLCYDTDNFAALEQGRVDTEKIIEFFESL